MFLSRLFYRKTRTIRPSDWLEVFVAWMSFSWGALLLLPGDTFQTTKAYAFLMSQGELFWSFMALMVSILQVSGLIVSYMTLGAGLRFIGCGVSFVFWAVLALLLFLGNPLGHGWLIYTSFSVSMFIMFCVHFMELYRDCKRIKHKKKSTSSE